MRELILEGIRNGTFCRGMTAIPVQDIHPPVGIDLIAVMLGDNPKCPMYGNMLVYMECHGKFYRCCYHVHLPYQEPCQANHMEYIHEMEQGNWKGYSYITYTENVLGQRAFWANTPTSSLSGDDLLVRQFMQSLKRYSVDHQLCKRLRKTDKEFIRNPYPFGKEI